MAQVVWTRPALEDLRAIRRYISRDSPMRGRLLVARIYLMTRNLEQFPRSGRNLTEEVEGEAREIFVQPYRIIYRVTPDLVEVVTVLHGARLLGENPDV